MSVQYLSAYVLTGFSGFVIAVQHKFTQRKKETIETNVLQLTLPRESYQEVFEHFFSKMSARCTYCKLKTFSRVGDVVSMGFIFELFENGATVTEFLSEIESFVGEGVVVKLSTNVPIAE